MYALAWMTSTEEWKSSIKNVTITMLTSILVPAARKFAERQVAKSRSWRGVSVGRNVATKAATAIHVADKCDKHIVER